MYSGSASIPILWCRGLATGVLVMRSKDLQLERCTTLSRIRALLFVGLLIIYFAGSSAPTIASNTFTVTSTTDTTDATPGDGICETAPGNHICTLRAAIQETNALPGSDTIIFPAGT
jgi:CSLREA domain-containing protein